jgi:hypothetical protein
MVVEAAAGEVGVARGNAVEDALVLLRRGRQPVALGQVWRRYRLNSLTSRRYICSSFGLFAYSTSMS